MVTTVTNVRLTGPDSDGPGAARDVEFDGVICAVREPSSEPVSGDVVDGQGRFLVPGLIDTHVHLGRPTALKLAVRAGVTTVVDLGTYPDSLVTDQRSMRGLASILSAGSAACAPGSSRMARMGFPAESGVTGTADAERYLDWRTDHAVDLVKIITEDPAATDVPALDVATITALVAGAHRRGLLTVAHVVTAGAFVRGLDAGVDILTHAPLDRPYARTAGPSAAR